jgi:ABC-type transport system involved in multi-copper enzyme maturation permease subunit
MRGTVFAETLRRSWRAMVIWGVALGLITLLQVVVVPDVDALQAMGDMLASLPPFVMSMLGSDDIAFFSTAEGYLSSQYFGVMLLIFAIYAVSVGINVTANDEERGIMDVQMSLPVGRGQLVVEKTLAYSLLMIGVIGLSFVGLVVGVMSTPMLAEQVDMGKMIVGTFNMIPGSLLMLAFTVFVGTALRRRGVAIALAAAFIYGSYFVDTLGRAAADSFVNALRAFSFYSYYDGSGVIQNGLVLGNVALLTVVAAGLVVLSVVMYRRRDIGL